MLGSTDPASDHPLADRSPQPSLRTRVPWFALGLVLLALLSWGALPAAASAPSGSGPMPPAPVLGSGATGWTVLPNEAPSLSGAVLGAPVAPGSPIVGVLNFQIANQAQENTLVQQIYTPGSPVFHHFLSGDQASQLFGTNEAEQAALLSYLQLRELTVYQAGPTEWTISGPASAMGPAFGTTFVTTTLSGARGYAPSTPVSLPTTLATGVTVHSGFQSVVQQFHPLFNIFNEAGATGPAKAVTPTPHAGLTVNVTNPFILYRHDTINDVKPPTELNESYDLTITGGTAPYTVHWDWGDGTNQNFVLDTGTYTAFHMFVTPCTVPDLETNDTCDPPLYTSIWVNDSGTNSGDFQMVTYPAGSPFQTSLFYNTITLEKQGYSGAGTKIGLGEECDSTYSQSEYTNLIDFFSTSFNLPDPTISYVGSGTTGCTQSGWALETVLDMEWSHSFAPNATLVVDLSASSPDEGDVTWNTLSNGVYIASNSWTGGYTVSAWTTAAAQGQSYLASSGDCGGSNPGAWNAPAADIHGAGIGGTEIDPYPSGVFRLETAWNGTKLTGSCGNDWGSGGGYDTSTTAPWFQVGMTGFSSSDRGIPDLAAIGGSWVALYADSGGTRWFLEAGTSLASPSWAGMLDLMYQYNGSAPGANPLITYSAYQIGKVAASYAIGLHDIVVGNNINQGVGYYATPGWNPVDGLGSPNAGILAELLSVQNKGSAGIGPLTTYLNANVTFGPVGLAVNFGVDVTGGGSALSGYSYAWNFGDGTTASGSQNIADHVYTTAGFYDAKVTVTLGVNSSISNIVEVHVIGGSAAPLSATLTADNTSFALGGSMVFTAVASGGAGGYSYSYSNLPTGCAASTSAWIHCTPTGAGYWNSTVTVTDAKSNMATSLPLAIGIWSTLSVSASANPSSVPLGTSTTITATASGGSGTYSYSWTGLPTGCTGATSATVACTPTTTGHYNATVSVSDGAGGLGGASAEVDVYELPLSAALSATPASFQLGSSTSLVTSASGGTGGYTYAWTGLPTGCTGANQATLTCTPTAAGGYNATVTVDDSAFDVATSTVQIDVWPLAVTVTLAVSTPSVALGGSTTLTATASGGSGTFSTYAWSGLPTGCQSANGATLTCQPSADGHFNVTVTVTDSQGHSGTSPAKEVDVYTAPSNSSPSGSGTSGSLLPWLLIIVVAVVAVGVLAFVVMKRRKGKVPPAMPPPPGGWSGAPGAPYAPPPSGYGAPPPPPPTR